MIRPKSLKIVYFALAIISTLWSWFYFIQYFQSASSPLIGPFIQSAMATPASSGVVIDAYFAGIAFSIMAVTSSVKDKVKWPWLYVAICFLIGLCLALPLYLGMRESAKEIP